MSSGMFTNTVFVPVDDVDKSVRTHRTSVPELREKYELDSCVEWIKACEATKVCLQFPNSLLHISVDIANYLECELNIKIFILGDTTYGSCCVDDIAAQHIGADALIHFGHHCLSPSVRIPVLYKFGKEPICVHTFVTCFRKAFPDETSRVLLLYDVAYRHAIDDIAAQLSGIYMKLAVSTLTVDEPNSKKSNCILGRNFDLDDDVSIDMYVVIFIGHDGHTLRNLQLAIPGARFYTFDPSEDLSIQQYRFNLSPFHRKRMYLIEKIKDIRTLGILIGTLSVANYIGAVERIKTLTKKWGIKCYIIAVGKPNVAKLANFPEVEAFVLVACPENSFLDTKDYLQPIVTMYEVELALNSEREWSERHITDFNTLLPGGCNFVKESDTAEESADTSNVSLISGRIHLTKEANEQVELSGVVSLKGDTTISHISSGGHYFSERSWTGLDQNLGNTEVKLATAGREGIPQKYANEPHL